MSIAWRRPVGYHRGGYEPVLRQVDCDGGSCCCRGAVRAAERHDLERSIPQFAELGAQVLRLRSTRKFFWIGERQGYAVAVFVRRCQGKARRGICQLPSNADFTFGGLAGKDALKFLVEIAGKRRVRGLIRGTSPAGYSLLPSTRLIRKPCKRPCSSRKQTPSPLWKVSPRQR